MGNQNRENNYIIKKSAPKWLNKSLVAGTCFICAFLSAFTPFFNTREKIFGYDIVASIGALFNVQTGNIFSKIIFSTQSQMFLIAKAIPLVFVLCLCACISCGVICCFKQFEINITKLIVAGVSILLYAVFAIFVVVGLKNIVGNPFGIGFCMCIIFQTIGFLLILSVSIRKQKIIF